MYKPINSTKALTSSSFTSMFFLGVAIAIVGAAARDIGLSPSRIGLMIAVQNLGFIVAVFVAGNLADTGNKARIMLAGSIILSLAFLTFYMSDRFWINALILCFIGAGAGVYEGVTDALLLDIHNKNRSRYVAVNHCFVTVGSLSVTLYLIFLKMSWRTAVVESGIVVALLALFYALCKTEPKRAQNAEGFWGRYAGMPNKRLVFMLFACATLLVGIELGTLGILTSFLADLRGFSAGQAKIGLVVFLAGIAAGRLFIGLLSDDRRILDYITAAVTLSALCFSALYFVRLPGIAAILAFVCGATISAIYPLLISLAGMTFTESAGSAIGLLKISIPAGGMLVPFLMSLLARWTSFETSLAVFPLAALAALLLFSMVRVELAGEYAADTRSGTAL